MELTKQPDRVTGSKAADRALGPRTTFLQKYPAITHFAVLTALLTPLAAVPYLLSKRRFSSLSRRLDKVSVTTADFRKELESLTTERAKWKEELSATTADFRKELESLTAERAKWKEEHSATTTVLRKELESFAIEWARQKKELSGTATTLRKELEGSAIECDKQKEKLSATTTALRKKLKTSAIESAKQKEELDHTSASLEVAREEVTRLHRCIEQLCTEHEATTGSIQQLLQERELTRQTSERLALSPLLGNSLADVANLMYIAEVHQDTTSGFIGVDRFRGLALELLIVRSEMPRH